MFHTMLTKTVLIFVVSFPGDIHNQNADFLTFPMRSMIFCEQMKEPIRELAMKEFIILGGILSRRELWILKN